MKRVLMAVVSVCLFSSLAYAAKTTYISTNHRFNYVKLKEVSGTVAEERMMSHPADLNEQGVRDALKSIKLERSYIIKKEVDTQEVFDEYAINYLAPNLATAFKQASPREEVVFSYMTKDPFFIIRNDRINICHAWVHDGELHIVFDKLYAKVTGDVDKRGNEANAIARARGLRMKLELGPGQMLGSNGDEVILDLHYNYAEKPKEEKPKIDYTMAGEEIQRADVDDSQKTEDKVKAEKTAGAKKDEAATATNVKGSGAAEAAEAAVSEEASLGTTDRMRELERLKEEGLISNKEYKAKRKEILKGL